MRSQLNLLDEASVAFALGQELMAPARLIPQDSVYAAVMGQQSDIAAWIHEQICSPRFISTREETVGASKSGHGVRPVSIWDLPSRIAYRALSNRLMMRLPELERSRNHYDSFLRRAVDSLGRYIVAADIAACYHNLSHGLVLEEVGVQTGEHDVIEAIEELLRNSTGRTYGLPQQSQPSDVLAEAFLAKLERALVRRNVIVQRYNDDFRFTCGSWSEVIRVLEVLEEETRRVGLTVNDQKTITWGRSKYEAQLDEAEELRREIAAEAELDLTAFDEDEYGEVYVAESPTPEAVTVQAAAIVLERWNEVAGRRGRVATKNRSRHRAVVQLLPFALATLASQPQTPANALDRCVQILRYERTLTPAVANYLSSRTDEDGLIRAIDKLISSRAYLSPWQVWWLQLPVARLTTFGEGVGARRRLNWARRAFDDAVDTPVLLAEAARTLARHGQISVEELLKVYDRSSRVVRPNLAAAAALLRPSRAVRAAITEESTLNRVSYDWSALSA